MNRRRKAEAPAAPHPGGRLFSVSQPCPGVRLRDFLQFAQGGPRFSIEHESSGLALAGAGITAELVAWSDRFRSIERQGRSLFYDAVIDDNCSVGIEPRLFGGFAFQHDFVPDNTWTIWSPAWFVLPHYQFVQTADSAWLTLNVQIPWGEDQAGTLADLRAALQVRCDALPASVASGPVRQQARLQSLDFPMSRNHWDGIIAAAKQQMNAGTLEKVVLSRVAEARLDANPDVDLALDRLRQTYPDCWRFLFEPRPGHIFFGATPELLAELRGTQLRSMAVAGSAPRGISPASDEALAGRLLADPKERHEHALVVDMMQRCLSCQGNVGVVDEPRVLKLANIQHLCTPLSCELHSEGLLLSLLDQLHPTPALGGVPREQGLKLISQLEPVPRGWYAAPVGCLDRQLGGTFVAAIRSAIAQERRLWLYAGVGVVAESEAQREWDESELKFRPMLSALGLPEPEHG